MSAHSQQLAQGISTLKLAIPTSVQEKMLQFLHFLQKWNQHYNLTAIIKLEKMISHHLLDSLAIAPYIHGNYILDVGTGAGFPGIPLAFYFPEKNFYLLDSNSKKISFLIQAKAQFSINNIFPVHARVETHQAEHCFDHIVVRAVGKIKDLIQQSEHLCCANGNFLLMKGANPREELQGLQKPARIYPLVVPGLDAERHLVVVQKGV